MSRTKRSIQSKHKTVKKLSKGFYGAHSTRFRITNQLVMKALRYAFSDRRKKKNEIKKIWIIRINASARKLEGKYNTLINSLKKFSAYINKKMLCGMSTNDNSGFHSIINNCYKF